MVRTGRIIHTAVHGMLFALSSVASGFVLALLIDLIVYYARRGTADEGDLLGIGLSIAFLTLFIVIGAIAASVLSLACTVLSAFLVKWSSGKRKVWGTASLALSIAYVLLSIASVLYAIIAAK